MLWHKNKNWEEHAQAVPMEHYLLYTVTPKGVQQCQVEFSCPRDMVEDGPSVSESSQQSSEDGL